MYVIKNFYILKIITMKKIFTLLLLFTITLSSSFAATGLKTTLNSDDLLSAKIFYINWEWYTKENNRLKKIENVKFYSIAGQRYIKKDSKIKRINETKLYKINDISYVKSNNVLITLVNFLKTNSIEEESSKWTFSDMYKDALNKSEEKKDVAGNILKYIFANDKIKWKNVINKKLPISKTKLRIIKNQKIREIKELLGKIMYEDSSEQVKKYYVAIERKKQVIRNVEKLEQGDIPNSNIQEIERTAYIEKENKPEVENLRIGKIELRDTETKKPEIEDTIDNNDTDQLLKGLFWDM